MEKAIAEFIGTFALVLFGCGAAVFAGAQIGVIGVALAFGLALMGMAYVIGPVSGCHVNPAVSLGMLVAGRMDPTDFVAYVIAQVLGAIAAAFVIYMIALGSLNGFDISRTGLGQNGWGLGFQKEYSGYSAFLFEFLATLLFVIVVLGATESKSAAAVSGIVVGGMLTLVYIVGIPLTATSVNPARSIGPALFVGWPAMSQLWLFILAPLLGGAVAGILFQAGILTGDGNRNKFVRFDRPKFGGNRFREDQFGRTQNEPRATTSRETVTRETVLREGRSSTTDQLSDEQRQRVSPGPLRRY